ncbi:DEAD/DEAH box helicase family protein [Novipirellula artificiosorum]|uniref:Type I restriction enzyme EcoKI subunit R n=1 Tax=Novipirellula artificiosorum TaxID=2528016 RepID=A0A5C6E074_9BACT|nr:DEAD/DEAH box helicase family protein [Novipirellula artificiosorum]TWU41884.1 type I restriction enzyme EcoKI subunit R [Novipirellula artificiosorum]
MSLDEQNHLRNQIEQALANAGWEFEREAMVVPGRFRITGDDLRERVPVADYLLRFQGVMLAVVEAKRGAVDLQAATEQATIYARRAGVSFAIATNGEQWSVSNLASGEAHLLDAPPSPEELISQSNIPLHSVGWGEAIAAAPFGEDGQPARLRPYQEQAILATLSHFAEGNRRASLLMSPKTGATYTIFQLVWKLLNSNAFKSKRVLFLTDRRHRVEESYQCFAAFGDTRSMIQRHAKPEDHQRVFFATSQMMSHDRGAEVLYEEFPSDFFDLVILDQCQSVLGSRAGILAHFQQALQIGLMDSPHLGALEYFGNPIYAYSLQHAINDGYLLPFLIESRTPAWGTFHSDLLVEEQFEKAIVTAENTRHIASDLWKALSRFDEKQRKTMVFCVNSTHAEMMTSELQRVSRDPSFAVHISSAHPESQLLIDRFRQNDESGLRVAVSVDMLSKVSIPDVSNIVLARPIANSAVFSNLISQGALPCDAIGKRYFTVFDYCESLGALDTDWMGFPENDRELLQQPDPCISTPHSDQGADVVESDDLRVIGKSIRALCNDSFDQLIQIWASHDERRSFRNRLGGVDLIQKLRHQLDMHGVDDVDVLAKVGFDLGDVPTRKDRVRHFWGFDGPWLRKRLGLKENSFERDENTDSWKLAFWRVTLDHYSLYGVDQLERGQTYQLPQFVGQFGSFQTLTSKYGGPKKLRADLEAVKEKIYVPVVSDGGNVE